VEEFRMALQYNNVVLPEQMIQFMRKWFLMHIKVTDAKYAVEIKSYLKGKSA
jgi:hemerythrin